MSKLFLLAFCLVCFVDTLVVNAGEDIGIYQIKKGNFSVKVTNYGARIISVFLPDKDGKVSDVVLGYDTIKEYQNDTRYFGAIVGRFANRIGGAKFTLNGTTYKLDANEGKNILHGGTRGFSQRVWKVKKHVKTGLTPRITLTYHSADGEEGFPGAVVALVSYTLVAPYKLVVHMKAKALNKATPVNLAQHSYWNLGGHTSGDILSNEVKIYAPKYTPVDKLLIPTGKIVTVKGTPYDFLTSKTIKSQIKKLPSGIKGFDINYALNDVKGKSLQPVAKVKSPKSGRVMKLWSNAPGVQFYTGNFIGHAKGKGGYHYSDFGALCLETQGFPDSVNHPNFPSTIIYPGKNYGHTMKFEFSAWKK
ncbi:epimerase/racemase [Lithospermum erythrorhizon]|uniref:Aldose 1-epimerase n=1 Tax=Lithospermum erythrorhizon TaxID=34254 RepID=A0AAV3PYP7_LITER